MNIFLIFFYFLFKSFVKVELSYRDFLVSSGAEIRPLSQWDLGDFFPQFEKKFLISKKKKKKNFFFIFF